MGIKIIGPNLGPRPEWAKAVIVAEYEEDQSDCQTDYFNTRTVATIPLAWSKHTRDNFAEMRKAAGAFKPTRQMGPGCDVYRCRVVLDSNVQDGSRYYAKGERSHWHSELCDAYNPPTFPTRAEAEAFVVSKVRPNSIWFGETCAVFAWEITCESIERREKYSMGHGYYLKGSHRYSSGWIVRKVGI